MSIDKAEWHTDTVPEGLSEDAAATHIGMFVAWAVLNGHVGAAHQEGSKDAMNAVRARTMTGREFFLARCDAKLTERDLDAEGVAFATSYYSKRYFKDYERTLCADLPSLYDVTDTWENYDRIAIVLDERFETWRQRRNRRWWQFWKR